MTSGMRGIIYLCAGNVYTFSTCSTPTAFNSNLTLTTTGAPLVVVAWDDDGCGTPGGLSQLTINPPASGSYFIRLNGPACAGASVATLQIQCSAGPCPGPGDDPCSSTPTASCNPNIASCGATAAAQAFPAVLGSACTTLGGSTAGGTPTSGVAPPSCGVYPNSGDVWFSATSSPTGTLALDITHVSATNLAMALYSASAACPGPLGLAQVTCNADLVAGVQLDPFISVSSLTPNTVYYVRVWPEANVSVGGTFQLCAYWPTPPVNDQPCGIVDLDMSNPACVPVTFNTQDATPLSGVVISTPGSPTCTAGVAGNDVWFRIIVPAPGGRVTVNTIAGSLTSMAMALYTGTCAGPLAEVGCNDNNPLGGNMPWLNPATLYATGTVLWVRMWSQSTGFGTFQICAYMTQPPANDQPCGAIAIAPQFGCMMTGISTENAGQTLTNTYGAGSIPDPSCGGVPNNDVWFTTVVPNPTNGQLAFDMDDAQMNDAALAVYRLQVPLAGCPGNFVQVPGACAISGSLNTGAGAMPIITVSGLVAGETLYIRVWRQSGLPGTAHLCVRRTDTPPVVPNVSCYYTLRMADTGGDGWNGSSVDVTLSPGGTTSYTINSGSGTISFPVTQVPLQAITIAYTAVGGFQNQISYSVINNLGALIYGSSSPPAAGIQFSAAVDCNLPPPPQSDCVGAFRICNAGSGLGGNPSNTGAVADLNAGNRGCLFGENQGLWYTFTASSAGTLAFVIAPTSASYTDYDFALWGPSFGASVCVPNTAPVRCSYAAGGAQTGLNFASVDLTEGAGGDSWVQNLTVVTGQYYMLYIDNFSRNGISFNFSFSGTANISCTITPVEFLEFDAQAVQRQVEVLWATAAEHNSSHYIVERSTDGVLFQPIGQVAAAGNSVIRTDYKFMDPAPVNGVNYYRLQQVDTDGNVNMTDVVTVLFRSAGVPLFVFPNPAKDNLQAAFGSLKEGQVRWRILDTSGRSVGDGSATSMIGPNQFEVPVSRLDAGSYILEVLDDKGGVIGNARFIKQ